MTIKSNDLISALIVDDEQGALDNLRAKIERYLPSVKLLAAANSAKDGLHAIQKLKPDLVFLDIEMPWMNGFEMLACLGDNIDFSVVFVTAYDKYAIRAFKTTAIDYLLKPVDKDDLIACVSKYKQGAKKINAQVLDDLKSEMQSDTGLGRVLIHGIDTVEVLDGGDIIHCEADSNYSYVYVNDGRKIVASKTLTMLEQLLDPSQFVRIHRSHIVNVNYVQQFSSAEGYEVVLKDGSRFPVSRRKKESLFERLSSS